MSATPDGYEGVVELVPPPRSIACPAWCRLDQHDAWSYRDGSAEVVHRVTLLPNLRGWSIDVREFVQLAPDGTITKADLTIGFSRARRDDIIDPSCVARISEELTRARRLVEARVAQVRAEVW